MLAPSAALAITVLISASSGNDKSPFLVLLVLGAIAIVLIAAIVGSVVGGSSNHNAHALALGAALPLVYAIGVVVLARQGWLDPALFLGFR
jgi:hypothetical protein